MIMEILSIVGGMAFMMLATCRGGDNVFSPFWFVDFPTLVIMFVFTVPVLMRGGLWKDFERAFKLLKKDYTCHLSELRRTKDVLEMMQKQIWYAGILTMMVSIIFVMVNISDLSMLGPNMAVAALTLFYAVVLEMLLLPLQLEVKRQIINYMELETEGETELLQIAPKAGKDQRAEKEKKAEEI